MLTIVVPFIVWLTGVGVGYIWFHYRSQKWADTAFLRKRLEEYRRDIRALRESSEVEERAAERYRIRSEVLDEMLESEAETLYILTGKKADERWERNSRITAKVEQRIADKAVEEAIILDSTAVAMGHEPSRARALLSTGRFSNLDRT